MRDLLPPLGASVPARGPTPEVTDRSSQAGLADSPEEFREFLFNFER